MFIISSYCEYKHVQADLLGDEIVSTPGPASGQPSTTAQTNESLLAEIFGSSGPSSATPTSMASPPPSQRTTVEDILVLFGSSNATSPTPNPALAFSSTPTPSGPVSSLQSPSVHSPPVQPAAAAAAPRLTSYTAYDKNELKVTLTPQTSPAKPGVIMILARFQMSGVTPATGLSFQAAVPKVGHISLHYITTHEVHNFSPSSYRCFPCQIPTSIRVQ